MLELVRRELLELAALVVAAVLSIGAAYVIAYLRHLQVALNERLNGERIQALLGRVWHLVEVGVLAAEAAGAAAIRRAVAEGRTGREDLVRLGQAVVDDVLRQLDDAARRVLAETVGDVRAYIEQLVEAQLERFKGEGIIPRVRELAAPKSLSPSSAAAGPQSA